LFIDAIKDTYDEYLEEFGKKKNNKKKK